MARMWPVLAGTDAWFYIVATTGLVTMVLGALIALFKDDLKALLAFSTVSHLGLLTMLLGFGTQAGGGGGRLPHHQPPDLQGRALHDRGDRRSRDPYPRHQAAGRPEAPDAGHLPDRDGRGAVDGGHPAVQRVPVQGDDAGGGLAHLLVRQHWAVPVLATLGALCRWPIPSASCPTSSSARCATTTRTSRTTRPSACGPRPRCWPCW
jgi:hypothetical protein